MKGEKAMDKSGIENKPGAATPSSGTIDRGHGPHRRPPIPITTNKFGDLLSICLLDLHRHSRIPKRKEPLMSRILIAFVLLFASLSIPADSSYGASPNSEHQGANDSSAQPVNPVVQWNRTLLIIVRTPGAQPPTVHSTRSFAIMHAAMYDAVNPIDRTHRPYLVRLS